MPINGIIKTIIIITRSSNDNYNEDEDEDKDEDDNDTTTNRWLNCISLRVDDIIYEERKSEMIKD